MSKILCTALIGGLMLSVVVALSSARPALAISIERTDFGLLAIEIDFDDLSDGTLVGNAFVSSGVLVENGMVVTAPSYAVSPPNVIKSSDGAPLSIRFPTGATRVGMQIDTDGFDPQDRQPQMRVFDADGNLLGSQDFEQGPDFVGFEFPDTLIFKMQLGTVPPSDPDAFLYSDSHDNLIFELPPSVGGTVELLAAGSDAASSAADSSDGSSVPYYVALATAVATGAIAVAAGGWYARRRWIR